VKGDARQEVLRWLILTSVAFWLFGPFLTSRLIGAGDALWYTQMLADFVLQWRDGAFPVFVGQSEFAFNGAVYPLRVAPAYQHLAGFIDLITVHRLDFVTLHNLVLALVGFITLFGSYLLLGSILPGFRWIALLLAILFVTSPGVWGLVATQDLIMSWIAVPGVPLAAYGAVRGWRQDDNWSTLAIASGLAWLWLAHAPIAFWTTAIVGTMYLARLLIRDRTRSAWARALATGALVVVLGHYPFLSLSLLQAGASPATTGAFPHPEYILRSLDQAFPQSLLPLSAHAGHLGDLQLGYALWLVLLSLVLLAIRSRQASAVVPTVAAGFLLVILFPLSPVKALWLNLPDSVLRLTYYWPMQRILVVAASIITFSAALGVSLRASQLSWRSRQLLLAGLTIATLWSFWETRHMRDAVAARTLGAEATQLRTRTENVALMGHSYGLYPALPPTFVHGVVHPASLARLLTSDTQQPLSAPSAPATRAGILIGHKDANPGILNLQPTLNVAPGTHYRLELDFLVSDLTGILQIVGPGLFREYALPNPEERTDFDTTEFFGGKYDLWTTGDSPIDAQLRLIPIGGTVLLPNQPVARFQLVDTTATSAEAQLRSLIPLVIVTDADRPAILQTPRMYLPHYQATINGQHGETIRTSSGLLGVVVPPTRSEVTVVYRPPSLLQVSYFATWLGWIALPILIGYAYLRRPRATPPRLAEG
jgi:hypothetical protein